jgi:hypothetical protein
MLFKSGRGELSNVATLTSGLKHFENSLGEQPVQRTPAVLRQVAKQFWPDGMELNFVRSGFCIEDKCGESKVAAFARQDRISGIDIVANGLEVSG